MGRKKFLETLDEINSYKVDKKLKEICVYCAARNYLGNFEIFNEAVKEVKNLKGKIPENLRKSVKEGFKEVYLNPEINELIDAL